MMNSRVSRRRLLGASTVALCTPSLLLAEINPVPPLERRHIMGFATHDWRDHFDTLGKATIIADTTSRALHFWSGDGQKHKVYPTSVPRTNELTKRGYTEIVRKQTGPSWTPTPSMLEENPDLVYMPPGPHNPLGSHAMYLSWPAYLIHGTHDPRKIGRQSSSGCIGMYNGMISSLFEICPVGTQVRVI